MSSTVNCRRGGCPPSLPGTAAAGGALAGQTYYVAYNNATNLLSYNGSIQHLLGTPGTDCAQLFYGLPPDVTPTFDQSWVINLGTLGNAFNAGGGGYILEVFVSRIHNLGLAAPTLTQLNADDSRAQQLVKYRIKVSRDTGTGARLLVTGEILQEVR